MNEVANSLALSGWFDSTGWDTSLTTGYYTSDPCNGLLSGREWFGVSCVVDQRPGQIGYDYSSSVGVTGLAFRVKTLALAHNNLNGNLPSAIYGLTALTELFLSGNSNLRGSLVTGLGAMISLKQLHLDSCSLSGPLPTGLNLLVNLEKLYVQNSGFSGPIPYLGNMRSLADWRLGGNFFTSGLPTYITNMTSLTRFDARHPLGQAGALTGTVPTQWANTLSPLRYL